MSEMPVWEATLDGRYTCVVQREKPYWGRLTVTDSVTRQTLLSERVGLAYDAPFGPDVGDVRSWQERVIEVVEEFER